MIDYCHRQSAHCESGVAAGLLNHQGIRVSEAMAFGMGGGLFFGYFPFIRINRLPLVTYRAAAGQLLRQLGRIPGLTMESRRFRSVARAMAELDTLLADSIPVGLQTGVYWLPYFPRALRFHFNAHNLVVYGKDGDDYLISDPVFPDPVRCPAQDLARARFASGPLAPRGKMYYLADVPKHFDPVPCLRQGIAMVCRMMLSSPFPLIGIRGIRFMADRLERWPGRLGRERADLHLGHVVRMQEEIGTGGAGFRFMYASFLQESAGRLEAPLLDECARSLVRAGDVWRQFAVMAARICKGRPRSADTYPAMAELVRSCAGIEKEVYARLRNWLEETA